MAVADEAEYLHAFNQHEARAWVGLDAVAYKLFGIEWPLLPARDVGTYGLPAAMRSSTCLRAIARVPHYDSQHHARRYHALAQKLQDEAREWFTESRLDEIAAKFSEAESRGRDTRTTAYPSPREMARVRPKKPGRNDLCVCGSMRKWKKCCGAAEGA